LVKAVESALESSMLFQLYQDQIFNCFIHSLAYAEIYLTIGTIFRRFDLELYETTIDDVKIERDFFVAAPSLSSKGIRGLVKGVM
jgi:hypothetical protein